MRNSLLKRVKKDGFEEHDITMALWIVQYKKSNITKSFFFWLFALVWIRSDRPGMVNCYLLFFPLRIAILPPRKGAPLLITRGQWFFTPIYL